MAGASKPVDVSTKQRRIARLARQSPEMAFTSLAYYIDIDWLLEAYARTRKDGAVGVDGQDGEDYAVNLMANLQSLLDRAKSGTYQAPPVRRVHIPKGGSATETRPLGIPTFEDKVLQRAVVMVLEAIYEQDFKDCSYGFRPGRSAHQALESLWQKTMATRGGWIVEVDVLDDWFEREVQPRMKGQSFLIRFADDFVMGFTCEEDARRVMDVLPKRFEKYGLTLHPEKTRLVPFERPSDRPKRPE